LTNCKLVEEPSYRNKKNNGFNFCIEALVSIAFIAFLSFDYSRHSIPLDDISDVGPGKDGILFIDNPHFLTVAEDDQSLMQNEDRVLMFVNNDQARAYPKKF
jgi:hypothetical protein